MSPLEIMRERISSMLRAGNRAMRDLDYDTDTRTVINSDDTIDGELRVRSIRHGTSISETLIALEQVIKPIKPIDITAGEETESVHSWISIVFRYSAPEGIVSPDSRWRGLAEAGTNAQDASKRTKIAQNFITARKIAVEIQLKRQKPEQVLVRIYFDPAGIRPTRGR